MMKKLNLKKLFNRYPKMETATSMEVKLINPDADRLDEVFGMTSERSDELAEKAFNLTQIGSLTRATAMVELSKMCNHPNELAYAAMALQSAVEVQKNPFSLLQHMMKNIK